MILAACGAVVLGVRGTVEAWAVLFAVLVWLCRSAREAFVLIPDLS